MKIVRLFTSGIIFALVVTGCTNATPVTVQSPTVESVNSSPTATEQLSRVLSGTFVSQAAPTSGEVIITRTPESLILELEDFSTSPGDDVYLTANMGAMARNAAGDNVVNDPNMLIIEKLTSTTGAQSYDLTYMMQSFPEVQSVTIYNYSTRAAFGSANLREN